MNHLLFLVLANAAMTAVCLGISANCRTPEQASLLSIYLVGFQLPLSGAVLALPDTIERFTQPFISAYWAWSGNVQGELDSEVLKAVNSIVQTSFSSSHLCVLVLGIHIIVGLILAYVGCAGHSGNDNTSLFIQSLWQDEASEKVVGGTPTHPCC